MYEIEIQDLSRSAGIVVVETSASPVQSVNGKRGAITLDKETVGLNNVNNTADIDKPVSVPVGNALLELEARILSQVQLSTSSDLEFQVQLAAGIDLLRIDYPVILDKKPNSVTCAIENNIDELIYNYAISNVSESGFDIEFSDYLFSDGYILHVVASR
jgi:hypothetical protein